MTDTQTKTDTLTMADIRPGQLFVVRGIGVLRKTAGRDAHPCWATDKADKLRIVYPDERVTLLQPKKRGN